MFCRHEYAFLQINYIQFISTGYHGGEARRLARFEVEYGHSEERWFEIKHPVESCWNFDCEAEINLYKIVLLVKCPQQRIQNNNLSVTRPSLLASTGS